MGHAPAHAGTYGQPFAAGTYGQPFAAATKASRPHVGMSSFVQPHAWSLLSVNSTDQFQLSCQSCVCCLHACLGHAAAWTRLAEALAGWQQAQLAQQLGSIPAAQYAAALAAARPQQPAQPQQVCA